MKSIKILVDEYPGDDAWRRFVVAHLPAWTTFADKSGLLAIVQDEEIAVAIAGVVGKQAVAWLQSAVLALDGASPDQLLRRHNGETALRTLVMRMG